MKNPPTLIVHAGAGNIATSEYPEYLTAVRNSAQSGRAVLEAGGSALDAVVAAVCVLEDHPAPDAGRGSVLNSHGDVEMDALLMDGKELRVGAVIGARRVRNVIVLAQEIMRNAPHNILTGKATDEYARMLGLELCPKKYFITPKNKARYEKLKAHLNGNIHPSRADLLEAGGHDTVGAVALDSNGNLAVATSTGGISHKWAGRVGDSPLVGSGGYADNESGAVSATGWGETLMRVVISKSACDYIAQGKSAQQAADAAIALLERRVNGEGGLIVLDRTGKIGFAYNTPAMARAWYDEQGRLCCAVGSEIWQEPTSSTIG